MLLEYIRHGVIFNDHFNLIKYIFLETIELKEIITYKDVPLHNFKGYTSSMVNVHTGAEIVQYCLNPGLSQEM